MTAARCDFATLISTRSLPNRTLIGTAFVISHAARNNPFPDRYFWPNVFSQDENPSQDAACAFDEELNQLGNEHLFYVHRDADHAFMDFTLHRRLLPDGTHQLLVAAHAGVPREALEGMTTSPPGGWGARRV